MSEPTCALFAGLKGAAARFGATASRSGRATTCNLYNCPRASGLSRYCCARRPLIRIPLEEPQIWLLLISSSIQLRALEAGWRASERAGADQREGPRKWAAPLRRERNRQSKSVVDDGRRWRKLERPPWMPSLSRWRGWLGRGPTLVVTSWTGGGATSNAASCAERHQALGGASSVGRPERTHPEWISSPWRRSSCRRRRRRCCPRFRRRQPWAGSRCRPPARGQSCALSASQASVHRYASVTGAREPSGQAALAPAAA